MYWKAYGPGYKWFYISKTISVATKYIIAYVRTVPISDSFRLLVFERKWDDSSTRLVRKFIKHWLRKCHSRFPNSNWKSEHVTERQTSNKLHILTLHNCQLMLRKIQCSYSHQPLSYQMQWTLIFNVMKYILSTGTLCHSLFKINSNYFSLIGSSIRIYLYTYYRKITDIIIKIWVNKTVKDKLSLIYI